jgi:hypothetical protein
MATYIVLASFTDQGKVEGEGHEEAAFCVRVRGRRNAGKRY